MPTTLDAIFELFETQGSQLYGMEAVTQLEHALQCAQLSLADQAEETLVAAALLHDIGHLMHPLGDDVAARGIDDRHEYRALPVLKRLFGAAVAEPVRLHVAAKQYLCAVDDTYWSGLSAASQRSLTLQGGIFSPEAATRFIQQPFAAAAVKLRRWDDLAKVPGTPTPTLSEFRPLLMACHQAMTAEV